MTFLVKTIVCSAKFHQNLQKLNSNFKNSPNFFHEKVLSLKVFKKILGRRMQRHIQNPVEHLRWSILRILVSEFQLKTKFAKSSNLDVSLGSEYASGIFSLSGTKMFAIALIAKSSNLVKMNQTKWFVFTWNARTNMLIWKHVNK